MKKSLLIGICAMSAMLSCTCKADGRQSTQTREANNFNGIEVGQGIRTNVSIGDEERVEVVAPDDVIDLLTTEVSKGKNDSDCSLGEEPY